MIPISNTVNITPPPTLVNTSVPGSIALRPPVYSVAPNVSSAGINNNARGNSDSAGGAPSTAETPVSAPAVPFASLLSGASADGIATAQTNFFAQLLGQGQGGDAHALLVVYEKLVEISQVRYKPSDAQLPEPQPSGVYGRILQQDKEQPRSRAQTIDTQAVQQAAVENVAENRSAPIFVSLASIRAQQPKPQSKASLQNYNDVVASASFAPAKAASAYTITIFRNNTGDEQSKTLESA